MTINEIQDQIVEEFSVFDDWSDSYQQLIDIANTVPVIEEKKRTDQFLIKGCQSKVWLDAELKDGLVFYRADSNTLITKGIVALLLRVLNGQFPDDILKADLYFIDKIGLSHHLSGTRSNGLYNMLKQMRLFALAFKTKMG